MFFLCAFAVGLFFVYIFQPQPNIVVKFPSPYNQETIYKNEKTKSCYKYNAENVSCPMDYSLIRPQPI